MDIISGLSNCRIGLFLYNGFMTHDFDTVIVGSGLAGRMGNRNG